MFVIVKIGRIFHVKFVNIFTIHPHTEFLMLKLSKDFHFFNFNIRGSIYICNGIEMSKGKAHVSVLAAYELIM
jgi:hypothetical protein